ncbi:DMT family transporter [Flavobacterium sp. UMI-01]|uniref:DMT family transporter n=1 Tax=Flavobacterium sp. UMI-01 TaxID=1441053 RepID=UPI001C7CC609|nr:DMT family transporter [Flavobacterium sp. UMI-01]GIZ09420.1 permease [Flavobacterium sp. UMI-01]
MLKDNLSSYLHLHFIVFIWGFTAILGALISIPADEIVWYRMLMATLFLAFYLFGTKKSFQIGRSALGKLTLVGLLIALHWIFFFHAIHIANVSTTLAIFSLGAFLASLMEPLLYGRKVLWYEVILGLIIIGALSLIMQMELRYFEGMLYALLAIFLGVLFTLLNGKLIQKHDSALITFYEFLAGFLFISCYFVWQNKFSARFFTVSTTNWELLFLLSSVCTAYAFTASVKVMKALSPYTVMLTTNLEPVYGILLAYFILGDKEKMSASFYIAAVVIIVVVILNGILKHQMKLKNKL